MCAAATRCQHLTALAQMANNKAIYRNTFSFFGWWATAIIKRNVMFVTTSPRKSLWLLANFRLSSQLTEFLSHGCFTKLLHPG